MLRPDVYGDPDFRVGKRGANVQFDLMSQVVALRNRPLGRYQHVQGHERAGAGLARSQGMKLQPVLTMIG